MRGGDRIVEDHRPWGQPGICPIPRPPPSVVVAADIPTDSGQQDLNLRPSAPKADALPNWAMARSPRRASVLHGGST